MRTSSLMQRPCAKTFNCPEDLLKEIGKCTPRVKTYGGTGSTFENISTEREKDKQLFEIKFSTGMSIKKERKETENGKIENGIADCKMTITKIMSLLGMENEQELTECSERIRRKIDSLDHKQDIEDAIKRMETDKEDILNKHSYSPLHQDIHSLLYTMESEKLKCTAGHIPRDVLGDLLRIRVIPYVTSTVLILTNELQRIATFSKYPTDVDISLIRLAQAGFYYQGRERETRCYSCGVTYSNWTSRDNPMEIHKRISPRCDLVTKNENVSSENQEHTTSACNTHIVDNKHENGIHASASNCRSNDTDTTTTWFSVDISQNTGQQNVSSNSNINHHQELTSGHSCNASSGCTNSLEANFAERPTNSASTIASISNETELYPDYSSLGIYTEKPRYSNYSPLQVRISSYQGWPSYLDQTPQEMAMAGFLFSGYNDYTRCFFCGGGLRNWEAGDDPWIEHARWFPECAFLKQNKGEAFISAVLRKQNELEATEMGNQQTTQHQQQTGASNTSAVNDDHKTSANQKDQLNSAAGGAVLEMGYSNEQVVDAIQKIKQLRPGETNIGATDILNLLLSHEETSQSQGATETSQSQGATETSQSQGATETSQSQGATETSQSQGATSDVRADDGSHCDTAQTYLTESQIDDTDLLLEENRQLRDQRLCKVCLDFDATIAFLPCGHIVCCNECAPAMRKCPICRTYVKGTVKTYLA